MSKIHMLDSLTANSIAAGEVVERPSSVVKELVENSLDAGASVITVEIVQGGIKLIKVTDNGTGLDPEDAKIAFLRHSTSKIASIDDLESLQTMGFRGEALASIASVSEVILQTRQPGTDQGIMLRLHAGQIIQETVSGCPEGTSIQVENLFFNTPARYKFLKRDQTEASYVTDLIERLSLARPDISFRLLNQGQEILHTPGNNDLLSSIFAVYGREVAKACLPMSFSEQPVTVEGFVTSPDISRHNRNRQNVFVNGRLITSRMITAAIDEAGKTWFMKGRYPALVLNIRLPVPLVDVNVHPQKMEVRFWDEKKVFHCIYHAISQALINHSKISGEYSAADEVKITSGESSMGREETLSVRSITDDRSAPSGAEGKNSAIVDSGQYDQLNIDNLSSNEHNNHKNMDTVISAGKEAEISKKNDNTNTSQRPENHKNGLIFSDYSSNNVITSYHDNTVADNALESDNSNDMPINAYLGTEMASIESLLHARIIGQAFQTYLILEAGSDIFLVDQHAAHERILYEKLINAKTDNSNILKKQPLLIPETIQVSKSEKQRLLAAADQVTKLGFEFDEFGAETILLRSVPGQTMDRINPAAAFRVIIDSLSDNPDGSGLSVPAPRLFESIACKAAVKANDLLHKNEMLKLLQDLQTLENPYHCPHGRPIIVKMSKHELEKKFKRIV